MVCARRSPPVSPSVVATILSTQNSTATCGSLRITKRHGSDNPGAMLEICGLAWEGGRPPGGPMESCKLDGRGKRWSGRYDPMLTVVSDSADRDASAAASSVLDELVREGARRMLAEALQAEVDAYIAR